MNEILKFKGHLGEKELEAKHIALKIRGLRDSLRNLLDPFADIEYLPVDVITEQAIELGACHIEYKAALNEIREIKRVLGRG